jgi:hypothetical protein
MRFYLYGADYKPGGVPQPVFNRTRGRALFIRFGYRVSGGVLTAKTGSKEPI